MVLRSSLFSEKSINSLISVVSTTPHYGGQIIVHLAASMLLSTYGLIKLFNTSIVVFVQLHILRPWGMDIHSANEKNVYEHVVMQTLLLLQLHHNVHVRDRIFIVLAYCILCILIKSASCRCSCLGLHRPFDTISQTHQKVAIKFTILDS